MVFTGGVNTYNLRVMRGAAVGTLRLMLGQFMGMGRTKAMHIQITYGATIITSSRRQTIAKVNVPEGGAINFTSSEAVHDGDDVSSVSQEVVDTMLARDLAEGLSLWRPAHELAQSASGKAAHTQTAPDRRPAGSGRSQQEQLGQLGAHDIELVPSRTSRMGSRRRVGPICSKANVPPARRHVHGNPSWGFGPG